jgi:hypothetical protein
MILKLIMLRWNNKKIIVQKNYTISPNNTTPSPKQSEMTTHDYLISQIQYATKGPTPLEGTELIAELLFIARPFVQGMLKAINS